jgi:hypothetical protein
MSLVKPCLYLSVHLFNVFSMQLDCCMVLVFDSSFMIAQAKCYISLSASNLFHSFLLVVQLSIYLMAQVGSIKLVGAANDISQNSQEPPACQTSQPKENATKSLEQLEQARQQKSNLAGRSILEPDVMDDDDVQIVLSMPRRRKKKRKRYEETSYFYSLLTLS